MYQSAGGLVQKCLFLSHTCRVSNSVGLGLTKLFFFFFNLWVSGNWNAQSRRQDVHMFPAGGALARFVKNVFVK